MNNKSYYAILNAAVVFDAEAFESDQKAIEWFEAKIKYNKYNQKLSYVLWSEGRIVAYATPKQIFHIQIVRP